MKIHTERPVSFAIKSVDSKARRFAGLASTWEKDLGNDVIHPGAFSKTLNDWRNSKGKTIPLLDHHKRDSMDALLGKMVDAKETADGLEAEFEMRDTVKAHEAFAAVEGGFIDGLSIGYVPVGTPKYEKGDNGAQIRHLTEIKLAEVSLVLFPMNPGARVDPGSIKSLIDAAKAGQLTPEEWAELLALHKAATTTPTTELATPDAPQGLAPDNPARIALTAQLRALQLRSLKQ